ncbi:hypothetical protein VTH06DRAFT_3653 [Thermothelomyces fergusii]
MRAFFPPLQIPSRSSSRPGRDAFPHLMPTGPYVTPALPLGRTGSAALSIPPGTSHCRRSNPASPCSQPSSATPHPSLTEWMDGARHAVR